MRATIIAECATSHGGSIEVAEDMIRAAADAGADYVKFQTYDLAKLHPADPQREWLVQAHLDTAAHERLMRVCADAGIAFLSTPFDAGSLQMLRELGLKTFKIASSESGNTWWQPQQHERWFVSWPWGQRPATEWQYSILHQSLTAIPLYPTPLEAVGRATLLDGWSDHTEGLSACLWALGRGVRVLEAHLCLPGRSRVKSWDKTPEQFRQLRDFAEAVCTMNTGVSQTFRQRWTA